MPLERHFIGVRRCGDRIHTDIIFACPKDKDCGQRSIPFGVYLPLRVQHHVCLGVAQIQVEVVQSCG
jgi:hypothetical protein